MSANPALEQILYISTLSPRETVDLSSILASARRNNRRAGITGLLMFNGKRFLQVLEGPADAVEHTFERIRRDPRHRAQVVLTRKQVQQREFGEWSMAFRDGSQSSSADLYEDICALSAAAHPNLRAELQAFARQL